MQERGVRIFSITDHDTLSAYRSIETPPRAQIVTGIEINTTWDDGEVHVLGYRLPLDDPALAAVLERNRAARQVRVVQMVELLRSAGHGISIDAVRAESQEGAALGRPHVGKALIRAGITPDIESAFRDFLRRGKPGYVPSTHITPFEAIDAIRAAGGISVLAHPGRLKDYGMVDSLAEHGLHGLEVFYPTHQPAQIQYFRDTATRLGLVMTAGADFHDIRYNKRGVGMEVDETDIKPFLRSIG